jgi:hypothetical protein
MNEGRKLGGKVEDKVIGFSKILIIFYKMAIAKSQKTIFLIPPPELQFLLTEGTNEIKAG